MTLKKIEKPLQVILGICGGGVCAFVAMLTAYYFRGVLNLHFMTTVALGLVALISFGLLGIVFRRYFMLFFAPVFNCFGDADGFGREDGEGWKVWLTCVCLLMALVAMGTGALFQFPPVFFTGLALFFLYAVVAPKVFVIDRDS